MRLQFIYLIISATSLTACRKNVCKDFSLSISVSTWDTLSNDTAIIEV